MPGTVVMIDDQPHPSASGPFLMRPGLRGKHDKSKGAENKLVVYQSNKEGSCNRQKRKEKKRGELRVQRRHGGIL